MSVFVKLCRRAPLGIIAMAADAYDAAVDAVADGGNGWCDVV